MPTIRVPEIEQLRITPNDRAGNAEVTAARRISQNFNEAGAATELFGQKLGGAVASAGEAYVKFQEHKEISQGAAVYAQMLAGKTSEWNKAAREADPNDPTVALRFVEQSLNPALDKFRDAFRTEGGRKWAESRVDSLRNHMTELTAADMSRMAGSAAARNVDQMVNALSVTVKEDPSALRMSMETLRTSIDALATTNPNLRGPQAMQFKQEVTQKGMELLVKAAVFGAIQTNPDAGMKLAEDPELAPYLNGMEVKQFEAYARQQVRMANAEQRAQQMWEKQQKQDLSDETSVAIIKDLTSEKPTITRQKLNELYDAGKLTPQGYKNMGLYLERLTKEETPARISQQTWQEMVPRIFAEEGDPTKITSIDAIMKELPNLTKSDFNDLVDKLQAARNPLGQKLGRAMEDFFNGYKASITKSTLGLVDGEGDKRFYAFRKEIESKVERTKASGLDPHVLFDPSHPEFVGRPERVNRYIAPLDQKLRSINEKFRGGQPVEELRKDFDPHVGRKPERVPLKAFEQ